jgi:agmatine deiminase
VNVPASTPRQAGYRFPAEWEPHRATWLAWPHNASDFPGKLDVVRWVFCELIRLLCVGERVGLLVRSEAERVEALGWLSRAGVDTAAVEPFVAETNRSWTRDFLPTWLVPGPDAIERRVGAVKWRFNGWARYDDYARDDAAGIAVAEAHGEPSWQALQDPLQPGSDRFVLEGGAIDTDGDATLLTTVDCLLGVDHPRNPGLDVSQLEGLLGDYLGVQRVVWLPAAVAGDDTSGHVDDVARFVAPGRVVVASEPDSRDENYRALTATRERLEASRDARGRRLEVIALPMPAPVCFDGQRLPASYANFYVSNAHVLVPTFNDPADYRAIGILSELFPGRRAVGIHCRDLVLGLGSLHCSTQQEPLATVSEPASPVPPPPGDPRTLG